MAGLLRLLLRKPVIIMTYHNSLYLTIFTSVAIFMAVSPVGTIAQELSNESKLILYETQKKSSGRAFLYEFLLPIAGHAYAGNARAGVLPAAAVVAGLAGAAFGFSTEDQCDAQEREIRTSTSVSFHYSLTCESVYRSQALGVAGLIVLAGGRIWGLVSASGVVKQFNQDLQRRLGISLSRIDPIVKPSQYGISVGLSVQLGR